MNFKWKKKLKKSIVFDCSSGLKVVIAAPKYITLKELFRLYAKKIGIKENHLGNQIVFIYSSKTLDINDNQPISSIRESQPKISVVDTLSNVIGGEI